MSRARRQPVMSGCTTMEELFRQTRHLIHVAKQELRTRRPQDSNGQPRARTLRERLVDLYISSGGDSSHHTKALRSDLLRKLVAEDNVNCFVVNLYKEDVGFTMMVREGTVVRLETEPFSYDKYGHILSYIDRGELPPSLLDVFLRCKVDLFCSGSVITEIRDYRKSADVFGLQYTLLKSTPETHLECMQIISAEVGFRSDEERLAFESELVFVTAEPLCLDPSPAVCLLANQLRNQRIPLRRNLIKKKKFVDKPVLSPQMKVIHALGKRKTALPKYCYNLTGVGPPDYSIQAGFSSENELNDALKSVARIPVLKRRKRKHNECVVEEPIVHERYVMELLSQTQLQDGMPRVVQCTVVTIMRTPGDEQYQGILCLKWEDEAKSTSPSFFLGSRKVVDKYIGQFTEIFTEEGCKPVRVTHKVPGREDEVSYTTGAQELIDRAHGAGSMAVDAATLNRTPRSPVRPAANFTMENILSRIPSNPLGSNSQAPLSAAAAEAGRIAVENPLPFSILGPLPADFSVRGNPIQTTQIVSNGMISQLPIVRRTRPHFVAGPIRNMVTQFTAHTSMELPSTSGANTKSE